MAVATQQQAREHHAQQAALAAGAALTARQQIAAGAGWAEILTQIASAQLSAAALGIAVAASRAESAPLLTPTAFAGVTSLGYPIAEPLVATIDARVPAPVEALPAPWWGKDFTPFLRAFEQLVNSEIQDAARSANQAESFAQGQEYYVRILVPPSCKRCVVLAGRLYRIDAAFDRHPGDDCVSEPVSSLQEALDRGLVVTADEAVARGWARDLTDSEAAAIRDGADAVQVINSSSGIDTATVGGHRFKVTRYNASRRALWRRTNPTALVRLRPEAIYEAAKGDRAEALRLLKLYGYLT